ncbi:MAG: 50S ribosomal protein L21e [Candidatus Aenigmarchaeota archaeon]|nr:50S ribosomal protein L21e [Candidatus Aenigmarchaeota archaeon]
MVQKSHGPRKGTRRKFRAKKITLTRRLKTFKTGDIVHIDICPGKKMPYHRFQGKTGRVAGGRGRAYVIELKDGQKPKKLIIMPEHLKSGGVNGNNK